MLTNSLQDIQYVGSYYDEYLTQIDRYKNLKRPSIFCRYLKLNKTASNFNIETEGTHDRFYNGVYYDCYEYTPLYLLSPIVNNSVDSQDKIGRMFDGTTEAVVYTIDQPTHNDIIVFPYAPNSILGEVFRVKEVSVSLNSLNKGVKYSKVILEKTSVEQNLLKYINTYVYILPLEKYIFSQKYTEVIKEYSRLQEIFSILMNKFDEKNELYYYEFNNFKISPLKINKTIYNFLSNVKNNSRYFNNVRLPFGVLEYNSIDSNNGLDLKLNKLTDLNYDNSPILLNNEEFLNKLIFKTNIPLYNNVIDRNFNSTILNYQINNLTLLFDLELLIFQFKGYE
jgi:hypothetical protein